ncbi:MAG: type II toxin-antitoxin system RelE/ParE family toxin [Promethearchaeota archaeon]
MVIIQWTKEAEIWLEDIHDYISSMDKSTADSVIQGIYQKTQILHKFPQIGRRYRLSPEGDIRILLYGHYRITYLIRNDNIIDILGIFHDSLDFDKYLH